MAALEDGKIQIEPLISHRMPISKTFDAVKIMADKTEFFYKILIEPELQWRFIATDFMNDKSRWKRRGIVFLVEVAYFIIMAKIEAALYLIPVPLGDDVRAEQVLPAYNREVICGCKYFIVESVKSAKRFFAKLNKEISTSESNFLIDIDALTFCELNEHTDLRTIGSYLNPLARGEAVGVLSDAGCPAVADPGNAVVEMAHKKGFRVVPLVGPSSILLSLMASGFNGQHFCFHGYLPAKPAERKSKIREIENAIYKKDETQIFIETPYRNAQMFESIVASCKPQTKLCVAMGLTCPNEFIKTQTIEKWQKDKFPIEGKIPAIFLLYK